MLVVIIVRVIQDMMLHVIGMVLVVQAHQRENVQLVTHVKIMVQIQVVWLHITISKIRPVRILVRLLVRNVQVEAVQTNLKLKICSVNALLPIPVVITNTRDAGLMVIVTVLEHVIRMMRQQL